MTQKQDVVLDEKGLEAACRAYNENLHGTGCPVWEEEHPPMRAAIRAYLSTVSSKPSVEEGWMPIETAPRDGTHILAVVAGHHLGTGLPFIPEVVEWLDGVGWWSEMWGVGGDYHPTHWRPLPAPPVQP